MDESVTTPRPWRLSPRGTEVFDLVLAAALVIPSVSGILYGSVWATVLSVAETVPLFSRRRRPTTVFGLVAGASAVQALTHDYPVWGQVAFPVALYSLARFGRPRAAWAGLGVGLLAAVIASTVWVRAFYDDAPTGLRDDLTVASFVPYLLTIGAIVLAAWALGTQGRIRQAYEETLLDRGVRLAAEAEQRAVMAAADERTRIAREMHDVVAHGLSVVIVQADGARYAAQQDPQVAVRTLDGIATTGREALAEMRRLLGLLRGTPGDPPLVPQPGLVDLPTLLAPDVASGRVTAELPQPLPVVTDGVALTAYRVVQESLTNVRKHAGPGARATVRLRLEDGVLAVEVVDDGRGAGAGNSAGLGLVGMRERVDVHGGTIEAGPAPGGGWTVRARIPSVDGTTA